MSKKMSEQEIFWAGDFGNDYIVRNSDSGIIAGNVSLFAQACRRLEIGSVLEVGPNIGLNLVALRALYPDVKVSAIEINEQASKELAARLPDAEIFNCSWREAKVSGPFDLILFKGVLIHVNPDHLAEVYERTSEWAGKFVLFAEYYNPTPMTVRYRGNDDRLFKRDFAGEFLAAQDGFYLRDYGFVYRGDPAHPMDDFTWFLMERL